MENLLDPLVPNLFPNRHNIIVKLKPTTSFVTNVHFWWLLAQCSFFKLRYENNTKWLSRVWQELSERFRLQSSDLPGSLDDVLKLRKCKLGARGSQWMGFCKESNLSREYLLENSAWTMGCVCCSNILLKPEALSIIIHTHFFDFCPQKYRLFSGN